MRYDLITIYFPSSLYVRRQCLMNMCTKFQVDIFKNGWDITKHVKNRYFLRHFGTLTWFSEFCFLTDFDSSKSDLGSFFTFFTKIWPIGCPRIIRTCSFSQFSPLRWNRWCCGFQNFQNYSSGVKAKRHTLPKSAYYSVQSLDQVSVGESFFPFCSKTKQATRYWQEAQPRFSQQTHWHDICWRA